MGGKKNQVKQLSKDSLSKYISNLYNSMPEKKKKKTHSKSEKKTQTDISPKKTY